MSARPDTSHYRGAVCPDPRCLGGTLPRETFTRQDYETMKDSRSPCPRCMRSGRAISDGTERDAMRVGNGGGL